MGRVGFPGKISNLIDVTGPFEDAPLICVAVSGGGDSMALALLTENWARALGGRAIALTVDHQLREGSAHEASRVSDWLSARHIEHHILTWRNPRSGSALQENARIARYDLMEAWCRDHGVLHLFVAHNAEDQAETFLMRLDKGSGPDGLSAMSAVSERRFCRLVRPLLSVSGKELRSFLSNIDQQWIEDPSNQNTRFERIRWRKILADQNLSAKGFCQSAQRYGQARVILDLASARLAALAVSVHPAGFIRINRLALSSAEVEISARVLARALMAVGGGRYPPRRRKLETLLSAIRVGGHEGRTLAGCRIESTIDTVVITRECRHLPSPMAVSPGMDFIWDKRFHVSVVMNTGNRSSALYLQPLGEQGDLEIKTHQNMLNINNIPRAARMSLPAFVDENGVLSVPHLNYSRFEGDEGRVLKLTQYGDAIFSTLNSLSGSGYLVAN